MSVKNRTQLKEYFETGKRPTQSQFSDLIDSMTLVTESSPKLYKSASVLLSCDDSGINYTLLENTLGNVSFSVLLNTIRITSEENIFDLEKTFVIIGALNEECDFDKVTLSLSGSTSNKLVLYCESIEYTTIDETGDGMDTADPDGGTHTANPIGGGVIINPATGMNAQTTAISFSKLPIEIRIYE